MDLDELEAGRASLSMEYKGKLLTIEYFPDRVGMKTQRAIVAMASPPYEPTLLIEELTVLIASWSLTRAGSLVPIDADGIGSLPMALSMEIARSIMDDFRDPKSPVPTAAASASPTPSLVISDQEERSATAPISPLPSSTHDGPASLPGTSSDSLVRLVT